MNVIIIGDISSTNLGDPILTYSTEYIIKQICENKDLSSVKTTVLDIADRAITHVPVSQKMCEVSADTNSFFRTRKGVARNYRITNIRTKIKWILKDKQIFRNRLIELVDKNDDNLFIIAGGALLSRALYYSIRINEIINVARRFDGKVVFNAVGIEKCSGKSVSRKLIQGFLKKKQVVGFSTRDHIEDVPALTNRESFYLQIPDPGIWASEAFGISKKESNIVGIGTISEEAYTSVILEDKRAESVTCDTLFEFWKSIIVELEHKNIPWKMFTNGGAKDCRLAYTFLKRNGYSIEDHLVPPAENSRELIEQISQFKAVVAHRLHALIVASSLKIPVVPVVWSDKVVKFSELINNTSYMWPDQKNGKKAAELLSCESNLHALYESIEKCKKDSYEYLSKYFISDSEERNV